MDISNTDERVFTCAKCKGPIFHGEPIVWDYFDPSIISHRFSTTCKYFEDMAKEYDAKFLKGCGIEKESTQS